LARGREADVLCGPEADLFGPPLVEGELGIRFGDGVLDVITKVLHGNFLKDVQLQLGQVFGQFRGRNIFREVELRSRRIREVVLGKANGGQAGFFGLLEDLKDGGNDGIVVLDAGEHLSSEVFQLRALGKVPWVAGDPDLQNVQNTHLHEALGPLHVLVVQIQGLVAKIEGGKHAEELYRIHKEAVGEEKLMEKIDIKILVEAGEMPN